MCRQVTDLYANVTEAVTSKQGRTKWSSKAAVLVAASTLFLVLVFQFSVVERVSSFLLLQSTFDRSIESQGTALIRLPNERLPRRMNPGIVLSEEFLREANLNTTAINYSHGEVRPFQPHGVGTHLYMHLGTYRSSARAFATTGSISRSIAIWHKLEFQCTWIDSNRREVGAKNVETIRPLFDFGGVYESYLIICHFEEDVGVNRDGGELWVTYSSYFQPDDHIDKFRPPQKFLAFTEAPGDYDASAFEPPFEYDVVYCGSPIHGTVNAQRIREWLAYHAFVFGPRSHFILYDAGGFSEDVMKVVQPWVDLGRVSVQNMRQSRMFHGYYHHQVAVLNDCLHKSQFMANWTFFFDVDEYLVVDPIHNLTNFLTEKAAQGVTTFRFDGKKMSTSLCALQEGVDNATRDAVNSKLWGFEKFVFNMHWDDFPRDPKYAIQARYSWATLVHGYQKLKQGESRDLVYNDGIWFHHLHGYLIDLGEGCRDFADVTRATWDSPFHYDNKKYSADFTLANLAAEVKKFEVDTFGGELAFSMSV